MKFSNFQVWSRIGNIFLIIVDDGLLFVVSSLGIFYLLVFPFSQFFLFDFEKGSLTSSTEWFMSFCSIDFDLMSFSGARM